MNTQRALAFRSVVFGVTLLAAASTCAAQDTTAAPPAPPQAGETGSGASGAPPPAPASGQGDTTREDGFRMGAFTFKPGGRVKLDVIRDFNPVGSEDSFDTRTILVDGSEGTNSNIHAKETRLNLDIRGMAENRELRMFI